LPSLDIKRLVEEQRAFFDSGATRSLSFRRGRLERLRDVIRANREEMARAAWEDLRKPPFETFASETAMLLAEIDYALKNLTCWASPARVPGPPIFPGAESLVVPEPYGVALIMAPWNYPFVLLLAPLVGAMAAGNCAVLKPSELSPRSSGLIARMLGEAFDPGYIAVVEGGMEVNEPLLRERFDYIFFTGGAAVGRLVMKAAAEHLTPVTLELGGKTPCIVESDARLRRAARRIAFGKWLNAGQTCIAPDYVLVQREAKERLLQEIGASIRSFYGRDPKRSRHYARIINARHFQRLTGLMEDGHVLMGGATDTSDLYIAPTVIDEPGWDTPVMTEEIFGPILPVLSYRDLDEAIARVNARPKPLALYFFSRDRDKQRRIIDETSSGGICINITLLHESTQTLPFGGVGESGMGAYHGRASFDTFTHRKAVFNQRLPLDAALRPPYAENRVLKAVMQRLLLSGRRCRAT